MSGRIIYENTLGNASRELEVRVKSGCCLLKGCADSAAEAYEILVDVTGKFEQFLSGHCWKNFGLPNGRGIRQVLYEIPRPYPAVSTVRNPGNQGMIGGTAQEMMKWLLGIHVIAQEGFADLGFSAVLDYAKAKSGYKIWSILKRVPSIVNLNWEM